MKRLSEVVAKLQCANCTASDLKVLHVQIGVNNITASTACPSCGAKDVVRTNFGELGQVAAAEAVGG